jgi:hypothetical protein
MKKAVLGAGVLGLGLAVLVALLLHLAPVSPPSFELPAPQAAAQEAPPDRAPVPMGEPAREPETAQLESAVTPPEPVSEPADEAQLAELDRTFPFAPSEGTVLQLEPDRVHQYLSIREAALAAFQGSDGDGVAKARAEFVRGLQLHGMSPREFRRISGALEAARLGRDMLMNEGVRERVRSLDRQARLERSIAALSMSAEEREAFDRREQELEDRLTEQMAATELSRGRDTEARERIQRLVRAGAIHRRLYERFQSRIDQTDDPRFDGLVADIDQAGERDRALGVDEQAG